MAEARYIMIGGFLGAGKSTAMARLGDWLTGRDLAVGLITNDQGGGLVDTTNLRSQGFRVEEIAGGCFCCRFDSLLDAARNLTRDSRPDVFLAEPVGSCTDLVATVSYPLRRIYGEDYHVAPFSVLVDPLRARRVLGLEAGRKFSAKVLYVYRKQLEEADAIVINKRDLLDSAALGELRRALEEEYPAKRYFEVSARTGEGLDEWFEFVSTDDSGAGFPLEIDYDTYADGEARLGWLNATVRLSLPQDSDGNSLLREVTDGLGQRLDAGGAEVAHLKIVLSADALFEDLAQAHLVRPGTSELARELSGPLQRGELIVNLRAEAAPDVLHETLVSELDLLRARRGLDWTLEHEEYFSPGRPVPTHRFAEL